MGLYLLFLHTVCVLMVANSLVPRLSPTRTKNRKERGEPVKIHHVIGRENLITCGRTNELAHAVRTEYNCDSFMADRMGLRRHYATLPGSTESYGELTQTRTFENHANLLAYLAN